MLGFYVLSVPFWAPVANKNCREKTKKPKPEGIRFELGYIPLPHLALLPPNKAATVVKVQCTRVVKELTIWLYGYYAKDWPGVKPAKFDGSKTCGFAVIVHTAQRWWLSWCDTGTAGPELQV